MKKQNELPRKKQNKLAEKKYSVVYFVGMKKTTQNTAKIIGIGAGIAAAAAGAYFLFGKNAKVVKARKQVKSWSLKMKGEILEKLENIQDISEEKYHQVIDEVAKGYKAIKTVDTAELLESVTELKRHWKDIKKDLSPKAAKKVAKKPAAKKVPAKKVAKK